MKSKFYALLFLFISFSVSQAQQKTISGMVAKANGEALSGVTVTVKGTKTATATNNEGRFTLTFPDRSNTALVFSSIGFKAQELRIGSQSELSISLEEETEALEDVVVIGYQTVRKKDVLASVSSISAKDLKDIPVTSAAEMLNGRLAGVTATTAEGSPDANVRIFLSKPNLFL